MTTHDDIVGGDYWSGVRHPSGIEFKCNNGHDIRLTGDIRSFVIDGTTVKVCRECFINAIVFDTAES